MHLVGVEACIACVEGQADDHRADMPAGEMNW